ncbi:MAG: CPBP family intramembrane metalloprotease [Patescibacteria group bacterium]|nr:CPBP family intramembrane metalloprotease [Patescibacteria group bacterium]
MQRNYYHKRNKGLIFLSQHRREATIVFSSFLILFVRFLFPAELAGEWFWLNLILFFVFPALIAKYVLRENFSDFGLDKGKMKIGLLMAAGGTVAFVAIDYILISKPDYQNYFFIYPPIAQNFWMFVWFELFVMSVVFFAREFFFRGFLQLGLGKKIGGYAILIQAVLFSALFLKQSWFTTAMAFFLALFAGYAASKSQSIYYSFAFLWFTSFATDIMLIRIVFNPLR